eukprot:COSAG01_NODE_50761_length_360_cov_1.662835_1_plen_26_part_10
MGVVAEFMVACAGTLVSVLLNSDEPK